MHKPEQIILYIISHLSALFFHSSILVGQGHAHRLWPARSFLPAHTAAPLPRAWHMSHHAAGCARHRCGDGRSVPTRRSGRASLRRECCCRGHHRSAARMKGCSNVFHCESVLIRCVALCCVWCCRCGVCTRVHSSERDRRPAPALRGVLHTHPEEAAQQTARRGESTQSMHPAIYSSCCVLSRSRASCEAPVRLPQADAAVGAAHQSACCRGGSAQ